MDTCQWKDVPWKLSQTTGLQSHLIILLHSLWTESLWVRVWLVLLEVRDELFIKKLHIARFFEGKRSKLHTYHHQWLPVTISSLVCFIIGVFLPQVLNLVAFCSLVWDISPSLEPSGKSFLLKTSSCLKWESGVKPERGTCCPVAIFKCLTSVRTLVAWKMEAFPWRQELRVNRVESRSLLLSTPWVF